MVRLMRGRMCVLAQSRSHTPSAPEMVTGYPRVGRIPMEMDFFLLGILRRPPDTLLFPSVRRELALRARVKHEDATLRCPCGNKKTPAYIFYCRKAEGRPWHGHTRKQVQRTLGSGWKQWLDRVNTAQRLTKADPNGQKAVHGQVQRTSNTKASNLTAPKTPGTHTTSTRVGSGRPQQPPH